STANASEEVTTNQLNESASLSEKLQEILSDKRLNGAIAGVSVRNEMGEELFEQYGDIRLHPASNMKLLTSAAALATLGEDYKFTTEILTDGRLAGKVLHGNV
ncbi:D-alanyl-D-alanine carboxypeptidase, partial [Microvirga sp. 3-52]|nr:D-alanyl-D-alanine carboxypeptidase [Microvirga sp. 3-52]